MASFEALFAPGEGDVFADLAVNVCHAGENGGGRCGAALQAAEHAVQARYGVLVGAVDVFAGAVEVDGVGDEQDGAVLVVVDSMSETMVEREFGQVHVIGGRVGQVLPVAHDVPAEVAGPGRR